MKKSIIAIIALCLVLMNACKDPEPEPDYRDQWAGYYSCAVSSSVSIGTGGGGGGNYTDTMMVSLAADSSCLTVSSLKRNTKWVISVDESGTILSGRLLKFGPNCSGAFSKGKFYFSYMDGGPNVVRRYEVEGRKIR